jgi:hypothetical protein
MTIGELRLALDRVSNKHGDEVVVMVMTEDDGEWELQAVVYDAKQDVVILEGGSV